MSSTRKHVDQICLTSCTEVEVKDAEPEYICPEMTLIVHLWRLCTQRIRATVNTLEQKRLLMDLDISMRTVDCFYTVTFYGALFREVKLVTESDSCVVLFNCVIAIFSPFHCRFHQGDVWICMELMDTSLDKFYKKVIDKGKTIPEDILGKITVAVRPFPSFTMLLRHLTSDIAFIISQTMTVEPCHRGEVAKQPRAQLQMEVLKSHCAARLQIFLPCSLMCCYITCVQPIRRPTCRSR